MWTAAILAAIILVLVTLRALLAARARQRAAALALETRLRRESEAARTAEQEVRDVAARIRRGPRPRLPDLD